MLVRVPPLLLLVLGSFLGSPASLRAQSPAEATLGRAAYAEAVTAYRAGDRKSVV